LDKLVEQPTVNFSPMPNFQYEHEQDLVLDGVDDTVVADVDSVEVLCARQPLRTRRAWVFRESVDA
jgi:hypothetical protein